MEALRRKQQRQRQIRIGGIVVAVIVVLVIVAAVTGAFSGGSSKKQASKTDSSSSTGAVPIVNAPAGVPCPNPNGSSPHYNHFTGPPPPNCADPTKTYTATIKTDVGDVVINLNSKAAPATVNNFVFLAGYHFYDGIIFHRVIPGFMDQTGDPTGTGQSGPGYSIKDEFPTAPGAYGAGALAMANTGQPNSGGSQIFLCATGPQCPQLPPSYTSFGQVTSGQNVVDQINKDGSDAGTPKVRHKIESVTIKAS